MWHLQNPNKIKKCNVDCFGSGSKQKPSGVVEVESDSSEKIKALSNEVWITY